MAFSTLILLGLQNKLCPDVTHPQLPAMRATNDVVFGIRAFLFPSEVFYVSGRLVTPTACDVIAKAGLYDGGIVLPLEVVAMRIGAGMQELVVDGVLDASIGILQRVR